MTIDKQGTQLARPGLLLGWSPVRIVFAVVAIALLIAFPYVRSGYWVQFATTVLLYVALAQAWNILGGYTGYLFLGTSGWVGLSAYATGLFMVNGGYSFWVAVFFASLVAGGIGLLVGLILLRLRTGYFAIATYGVAYILRELANNLTGLTGGGMGLLLPLVPGGPDVRNTFFYLTMLALVGLFAVITSIVHRSRLGYALRAIREDEDAAPALGINTSMYKMIAFTICAWMMGLAGGVYGFWLGFLEPDSAFDPLMPVMVIAMAMLGGPGTVWGPVVGGIFITGLSEIVWGRFLEIHLGLLGLLLMLIVIFTPRGFMEVVTRDGRLAPPRVVWANLRHNARQFRV